MDEQAKLVDLVKDFDNSMLVTKTPEGSLHARPMAIADCNDVGVMWFVTQQSSGKVSELQQDHDVLVTLQSSRKFATVCGRASIQKDKAKLDEVWNEAWKVWFPKGKSDPDICLIRVEPTEGEYWDNSGAEGLKYMLRAGKAYVQGKQPELDSKVHASVKL